MLLLYKINSKLEPFYANCRISNLTRFYINNYFEFKVNDNIVNILDRLCTDLQYKKFQYFSPYLSN